MFNNRNKVVAVLMGGLILVSGSLLVAKAKPRKVKYPKEFYIYQNRGERVNHFIPSGWMGDFGDLKFSNYAKDYVAPSKAAMKEKKARSKGKKLRPETCIQIKYSAERKQDAGWAGIYWQHPANNWGDKRGGYDLSKYKKLEFWARGETGEEIIDKFFIGGITGQTEEGDSDEASISPVELTKKWQKYEIDLTGLDMSHIIGGFGFAANADANPDGYIMYLDEIKLIR